MKLSYLITCHNEGVQLRSLLFDINIHRLHDDEVIVIDDNSDDEYTKGVLTEYSKIDGVSIVQHSLNNDYGAHKNWGTQRCSGDYIFQIDADELPTQTLLANVRDIIESNPDVELFFLPRINDYIGVTPLIAQQWGWRLTPSPRCENRLVINWPDYQGRIYKRIPERIRWDRKLHEKIEGHQKYSILPADEDLALYHRKTIEKQIQTNVRYNNNFTQAENMGHKVI